MLACAMAPRPQQQIDQEPPARRRRFVRLSGRARLALAMTAAVLAAGYATVWRLDPWDGPGRPKLLGTHEQLGLAPCAFRAVTGLPCPTCGMTTCVSHVTHGDLGAAAAARPGGVVLALRGLVP